MHDRHGLGDTALSEGISGFIEDIKAVHPGIFVHSVQIPEGGSSDDERKAGFVSITEVGITLSMLRIGSGATPKHRQRRAANRSLKYLNSPKA